jgi:hypothetical protein
MTLPINIPYPHQPPKSWEPTPTGPYGMPPHHHFQESPAAYSRVSAPGATPASLLDKYAAAAAVVSTSPTAPQFSYTPPNAGLTHQQMMAAAAAAQRSLFTPPHSAHGLPSPSSDGYFYRGPHPSAPAHHGRERSGSGVNMGVGTADDMEVFVARGVQVPTLPMTAGGGTGTGGLMTPMF